MTKKFTKPDIEKLASVLRGQWAQWTTYFLRNFNSDNLKRWEVQPSASYDTLSEKEKESDRRQAKWLIKRIKDENIKL